VIKTTMAHLSKEQKRDLKAITHTFQDLCLDTFTISHSKQTVQKLFPKPLLHGKTITPEVKGLIVTNIHRAFNSMTHHTFINKPEPAEYHQANIGVAVVDGGVRPYAIDAMHVL
jgi:hypothetical protein